MYNGHPLIIILSFFWRINNQAVCKALNTHDIIIVMGDFNTDITKDEAIGHGKLDVFCNSLKFCQSRDI